MAGVFPEGGVNKAAAINALQSPDTVSGCPPLWHGQACRPIFDPASANAVISEIVKAVNDAGLDYDCEVLDNLSRAIQNHSIQYTKSVPLPQEPYLPANGPHDIVKGSFTVPNSSPRTIRCFATAILFARPVRLAPTERITVVMNLSDDNTYTGSTLNGTILINENTGNNLTPDAFENVNTTFLTIPPGGRTFFYKVTCDISAANSWQIVSAALGDALVRYRFYGTSANTYDDVSE